MSSSATSSYLGTDSRFAKVVLAIERDIIEGRLPADSPLKSLRELASDFGVSQMVIFKAMDVLERKGLIYRISRRGIFVRPERLNHSVKNILIFALDLFPLRNPFVRSMLKFINYLPHEEHYSFSLRLACSDSSSSVGHLADELLSIEKLDFPDCALIMPMGFLRKDIERVLRLPFPVIFVGDFMEGDYEDLNYIRISINQDTMWYSLIEYIKGHRYKTVIHLLLEYQYKGDDKRNYKFLADLAKKHRIDLIPLWVPCVSEEEVVESIKKTLCENRKLVESSDLLVNIYHPVPDPGFPLPDVCCLNLGEDVTPSVGRHMEFSREEQFEAIREMIGHLEDFKNQRLIRIVDGHVNVMS